jgi:hypothetical protein
MPNVSNLVKTIQDIMRKDAGTCLGIYSEQPGSVGNRCIRASGRPRGQYLGSTLVMPS